MKINFKNRSWRTWVSVILSLPILVVALTAIFIAHKKALGTEESHLQLYETAAR